MQYIKEEFTMAVSTMKTVINAPVRAVWELVTKPGNYGWRSDLEKAEIISPERFDEYTPNGYVTHFTVTFSEECKRWELDMENTNLTGHWVGIFTEISGEGKDNKDAKSTQIEFTEDVTVKKIIMKPFVKGFLKKQQEMFAADLRKAAEGRE